MVFAFAFSYNQYPLSSVPLYTTHDMRLYMFVPLSRLSLSLSPPFHAYPLHLLSSVSRSCMYVHAVSERARHGMAWRWTKFVCKGSRQAGELAFLAIWFCLLLLLL